MSRPKELRIGPFVYRVKWDAVSIMKAENEMGSKLYGRCKHFSLTIAIDAKAARGQQRDTLLHEALHAVIGNTGLQLDDETEERFIRTLSPLLLDLLRRNPKLVSFLLDD